MTLAVHQHKQHRWVRRSEVISPSGVRATVRPLGAEIVGLLSVLVGAWGGICVFVGPYFGYRPTSATTWQWTTNNWLLHLVPGAVAVVAGFMILTLSPMRRAGGGVRSGIGLMGLLLAASGTWFVIGPAIWPTFQSSPAYATGTGAWTSFWNQLGANLGPGLLLAFFGGMAVKAGIARPALAIGEPEDALAAGAVDPAVAPGGTARSAAPYGETAAVPAGTARRDAGYDETAAVPAGTARRDAATHALCRRGPPGGTPATTRRPLLRRGPPGGTPATTRRAPRTGGWERRHSRRHTKTAVPPKTRPAGRRRTSPCETETTVRRARLEIPTAREQELLSAFIDAYSATETRSEVDRFLRAIFSAHQEPSAA